MDLSFSSFDRDAELVAWPGDLAALMVGVAARQGASPTALVQGGLPAIDTGRIAGRTSFNPAVAALLAAWTKCLKNDKLPAENVNGPFTATGQGMFNACCQNDLHAFKPGPVAPIEDQ